MLRLPSLTIFRHRLYLRYWWSRVLAVLAMQVQTTAMGWQVYDAARDHGQSIAEAAFVLGLVGLAQFLPLLVLSLFGGFAADRYSRKWIVFVCTVGKSLICLGLASAAGLGVGENIVPVILTAAVFAGAINAFLPAAQSALLPMLVPRQDLPLAVAWSSMAFQTSVIAGPAVGGLLYAFGPSVPYGVAFAMLVTSALMILLLRPPPQAAAPEAQTLGMISEGLRFVWSNKIVLGAISLDLVVVLLAGAVALLPVFARDILHAGPQELGVLRAAMGVGATIVAIMLAAAPLRRHVGAWMFGATIIFGLMMIVFGVSQYLWVSAAALAVAGGVDMISVYVRQTLIQLATPDAMRGRVSAVSYVFISASNELGDFEAGLMARIIGPMLAVSLGGALSVAASIGWIKMFPALAKADGFEPKFEPPPTGRPDQKSGTGTA